jgi:hypothetical protein
MALSTAFVDNETELMLNRFALGLAEGGVLTCKSRSAPGPPRPSGRAPTR